MSAVIRLLSWEKKNGRWRRLDEKGNLRAEVGQITFPDGFKLWGWGFGDPPLCISGWSSEHLGKLSGDLSSAQEAMAEADQYLVSEGYLLEPALKE
jgi:hypothetical protein